MNTYPAMRTPIEDDRFSCARTRGQFDHPPGDDQAGGRRRELQRGAYASFPAPRVAEVAWQESGEERLRILVATTLPAFADGLRGWLDIPEGSVVGICGDVAVLPVAVQRHRPHLLVATDELASAELVSQIHTSAPQLRVMILIAKEDARHEVGFVQSGAGAVVPVTADRDRVVAAVLALLDGQAIVSTAALHLLAGTGGQSAPSLTPRQRQVLELLAMGKSTAQIAERLVVTPSTVKSHMRHIGERVGVSGRLALAVNARQLLEGGIVSQAM